MSTERQIQASRVNGSKSRGATTPEGKLASSRNAITHGMLSGTIVIKGESRDRFLSLLAALYEEFQPRTPFEESLIEDMAAARWRRMRIWGMEKAVMEHEMSRQAEMSGVTISGVTDDAATSAALAFRALGDNSRSLDLINRYDSRYQRDYLRAHRRFLEVLDRRTPPSAQPAQPEPPDNEGTFPGGGTGAPGFSDIPQESVPPNSPQPPSSPLPAEPATPAPEKVVLSKRTREVAASNAAQAQVRCAADSKNPAQAQVRCAVSMNNPAADIQEAILSRLLKRSGLGREPVVRRIAQK